MTFLLRSGDMVEEHNRNLLFRTSKLGGKDRDAEIVSKDYTRRYNSELYKTRESESVSGALSTRVKL